MAAPEGSAAKSLASAPPALPVDLRKEVEEAFSIYATPGKSEITKAQLGSLFRALGQTPTDAELADLLAAGDLDGNRVLSLEEVKLLVARKLHETSVDNQDLKAAFEAFDTDGDGVIGRADLKNVLDSIGGLISELDFDSMFNLADRDADGRISYADFLAVAGH